MRFILFSRFYETRTDEEKISYRIDENSAVEHHLCVHLPQLSMPPCKVDQDKRRSGSHDTRREPETFRYECVRGAVG